ncbi:acyltransferase [Tsuneonella flava]|uniref:Acyltransferase n=1 Tax=Tsuneonella flava TaxID=2055955 RepID=A0ABX7KAY3_9SPHN|nr:acyltransferase [Tsuneonella flava]QSB45028.1 acyltransferase [Tsuneonella flava]
MKLLRLLAALPKIAYFTRGAVVRALIVLSGGKCEANLRVEKGFRLRQGFHPGLSIGRDVYLGRNTTIDCLPGARLEIGDNVTLTEGCFISCCEAVTIGRNSLIGEYCSIRDANHDFSDLERPICEQAMLPDSISIGEDIWIGRGSAILSGVTIGTGAVIGANSVVTRSIPSHAVAFGAPAKVKGSRLEP